jgi:hypothetical protein
MTATNTILTPGVIAKEALMLLDNNLVLGNLVHRGYEDEVTKQVNGYKKGGSVLIRKPAKYTWRAGATAAPQDSTEKTLTLTVNTQGGVDLQFSSSDMTLKIGDFADRFLKGAMITIANQIDADIARLYRTVWNWVGTPGTTLGSFAQFGKGPQRLTEMAVPDGERIGVLSPADKWGLLGGFTGAFVQDIAKPAIERAKLPLVGNVDLYETQVVKTHTVGTKAGTPLVNGASQNTTYAAAGATNSQSLMTDGWTASSAILKQGDVFTIAGVFAVNPVSKDVMPYLQQFVVNADISADGSGNATLNISPAIITTGAYQTVSAAPADNAAITVSGTAATGYPQNLVFHKNAFALVMVPMEKPAGVPDGMVGRETYKGISVRLIPYYDGTNDIDNWRLDVLYTVAALYPDLATRLSGS